MLTAAGSADGNLKRRHRPKRLIQVICEVAKVAVRHDHQMRILTKQGARRPFGKKPTMLARQRFHPAEVWKSQSSGLDNNLPDWRLARLTGPEARYA